ncbi:MAG: hypothetical protein ACYSWO_11520 [Planctomycetota bacterium]|jgi:hypothetical protein
MKRLILIVSCLLVPVSGWATESQSRAKDEHLNLRLKVQDEQLEAVAEFAAFKRDAIEQGHANSLNRLRHKAQNTARRIPFTHRFLWTEFSKMNALKSYPENYFWDSELKFSKDQALLRLSMIEDYFTDTITVLLLDKGFRNFLEQIVYVNRYQNSKPTRSQKLLYREAVDLLRIVERFHREAEQIESRRKASLAHLGAWERDRTEDVQTMKREIGAEASKPKYGVVSAIGYGQTAACCMVTGANGTFRLGDAVTGDVKVARIERDRVEFDKNGKRWIQKIGEPPNSAW